MSDAEIDRQTRLLLEVQWIVECGRSEQLLDLLREAAGACGDAGSAMIGDLIRRFCLVSDGLYRELLCCLAEFVTDTFALDRTVLCAATADDRKDSGQAVLYDLVTALSLLGQTETLTCNRYDHAHKVAAGIDDVVLIDEFVGTGRSMAARVARMRQLFAQKGNESARFHILVLAGMQRGLRLLKDCADTTHVGIALRRGIGDYDCREEARVRYELMSRLEGDLAAHPKLGEPPCFGDGQCEALFARRFGNCPNSVFPVFWWPVRRAGERRNPMFPRAI